MGPSFLGSFPRPSGCPSQSSPMLCPWVLSAWVGGGQLLWPWERAAAGLPMKPHPTEGIQKPQARMVTRTPWITTPPCLAMLKAGGAGTMDIPGDRLLSYKPLLPTHSLRCYTHIMFVTCHFMLGYYTSALMTHVFVPSSLSTQPLM